MKRSLSLGRKMFTFARKTFAFTRERLLLRRKTFALWRKMFSLKTERALSNGDMASRFTRNLSDIPGADIRVIAPSELVLAQGAAVDLMLRGPGTLALQELGARIKRRLPSLPGLMNVRINMKAGKSELVFEPRRKQISSGGLTVQAVALALGSAVDGMVATVYRENDGEYDIRVKIEDSAFRDIEDLKNIPVRNSLLSRSRTENFSI
ncbi:hypothetical protein Holit_00844 [Hollandina sp. SP2]